MLSPAASAPGKVIIAGEYAVLDGAPALVMAVDRRASAALAAPGERSSDALPELLGAVCRELDIEPPSCGAALDTTAFYATDRAGHRRKLGLGSSAALTAALCRLLLPADAPLASVLRFALAAHRRFQAGHGSGLDVAASITGGLLSFRLPGNDIEALSWPGGLYYSVWWSGIPASTRASLEQWSRIGESTTRRELSAAAGSAAGAWSGGSAVLPALANYADALAAFDRQHGLGIFGAGHGDLAEAARRLGAVYKPCGAGGGDIGIALSDSAAILDAFAGTAVVKGFQRLELSIDSVGVRLGMLPSAGVS